MRNVSIKGEDIRLISGKCYYIIDALYLNNIKLGIATLNISIFDPEVEEKIFPYTEAPFAKITSSRGLFHVMNIKKASYENIDSSDRNYFSSDTGLVAFVSEEILLRLLPSYDYNTLVDTITEDLNFKYWDDLASNFNMNDLGLILAPGINSGYEFEGSGIYKIEMGVVYSKS